MRHYIYLLSDPNTLEVRYVGQSNNPKRRYNSHMKENEWMKNDKRVWIDSLRANNQRPILTVIFQCEKEEVNYWESFFARLFQDSPLLNKMPFQESL